MTEYQDELKYKLAVTALLAAGVAAGVAIALALMGPDHKGFAGGPALDAWSLNLFATVTGSVCLALLSGVLFGKLLGYRAARGEAVQIEPNSARKWAEWWRR